MDVHCRGRVFLRLVFIDTYCLLLFLRSVVRSSLLFSSNIGRFSRELIFCRANRHSIEVETLIPSHCYVRSTAFYLVNDPLKT